MVTSPLLIRKLALTSESDSLSEIPRAFLRMSAVPSNTAFSKQLIVMEVL